MSENEKKPTPGELISEEQLDAVAGGVGTGDVSDPYHSSNCWFRTDGVTREDGRTKCISHCKGKFKEKRPVSADLIGGEWWICCCWGTDNCVDKWHKHCGHTARTNW